MGYVGLGKKYGIYPCTIRVVTKSEQCQLLIKAKGPLLKHALASISKEELLSLFQVALVSVFDDISAKDNLSGVSKLEDVLQNGEGFSLISQTLGFTLILAPSPKHRCPRCWLHRANAPAVPCALCMQALYSNGGAHNH